MGSNKATIINRVSKEHHVSPREAQRMVEAVLSSILSELLESDRVAITGFGTLSITQISDRLARNPQNGEKVVVPAHRRVKFSPGTSLKRYANGHPLPEDRSVLAKKPKGAPR